MNIIFKIKFTEWFQEEKGYLGRGIMNLKTGKKKSQKMKNREKRQGKNKTKQNPKFKPTNEREKLSNTYYLAKNFNSGYIKI